MAPLLRVLSSPLAMTRPVRFEHHQWLGDKRSMRVHDLDNTTDACAIDELVNTEKGRPQFATFGPDVLAEARNRGYRPCPHCAANSLVD
jgi:hypothetical protein